MFCGEGLKIHVKDPAVPFTLSGKDHKPELVPACKPVVQDLLFFVKDHAVSVISQTGQPSKSKYLVALCLGDQYLSRIQIQVFFVTGDLQSFLLGDNSALPQNNICRVVQILVLQRRDLFKQAVLIFIFYLFKITCFVRKWNLLLCLLPGSRFRLCGSFSHKAVFMDPLHILLKRSHACPLLRSYLLHQLSYSHPHIGIVTPLDIHLQIGTELINILKFLLNLQSLFDVLWPDML